MSCINQSTNENISFSKSYISTFSAADLLALDDLYASKGFGASQAFTEDMTHGLSPTIEASKSGIWNQLTSLIRDTPVFTIADGAGEDALDFSGFSVDQTIDLMASVEASTSPYYSSINGRAGILSIAVGTAIENAIGGSAADVITGNSAANSIDGKAGNDTMAGGDGNDTYIVDSSSDVVTESLSGGSDLIEASVSYAAAANVENLTLTGTGNFNATGNNLNNFLTGNSGDNSIDGGSFVVDSDGTTLLDLPACCESV